MALPQLGHFSTSQGRIAVSSTMKLHTSNKKLTDAQGLVNRLPEDIICRILICLPLNDAAKTCPISRKWLCAWKGLPKLRFDAEFFANVLKRKMPTADEFCNILSSILLYHVGYISEFYVCIPELKSSSTLDIGPWISFLSRNNVKDITIKNMHKPPLKLSYHMFSCLNLEKLMLDNCVLNLLPFFEVMRNLRNIEFENVTFMGNSLTDFMATCPVLESLTLNRCKGFQYIDIVAPNLKYLTVFGKFESVYFRSAEKLICFSITLEEIVKNYQNARTCDLIAYLAHPCRIESLSFGGHFCEFLTAGKIGGMFPICYRWLKSLQLSNIKTNDFDECSWVIQIIRSCPVLEVLKIAFSSKGSSKLNITFDPQNQLSCLRKVHLSSVMGRTIELTLIELLLRCSPAMETMCIERDEMITNVLESTLTQKLMNYRRASPEATIVYMKP